MSSKNNPFNFKKYISTSGIIKICIKIILISSIILIILESQEPTEYSINEIENLTLNTPISINGIIEPIYIEKSFSIVNIKSSNISNPESIIGTISSNISNLNLKTEIEYKIIGKVSIYNSQKQISISQILKE